MSSNGRFCIKKLSSLALVLTLQFNDMVFNMFSVTDRFIVVNTFDTKYVSFSEIPGVGDLHGPLGSKMTSHKIRGCVSNNLVINKQFHCHFDNQIEDTNLPQNGQ